MTKVIDGIEIATSSNKGAHAKTSNGDVMVYVSEAAWDYINPEEALVLAEQIKTAATEALAYEQELAAFHKAKNA